MSDGQPQQDPAARAACGVDVRAALQAQRRLAVESVEAAGRDHDRLLAAARSVATDDEHDPDGPGLATERGLVEAFRRQAQARVATLDRALERLDSGRYGRCDACGGEIGAARLVALPGTSTCIDCARQRERR